MFCFLVLVVCFLLLFFLFIECALLFRKNGNFLEIHKHMSCKHPQRYTNTDKLPEKCDRRFI